MTGRVGMSNGPRIQCSATGPLRRFAARLAWVRTKEQCVWVTNFQLGSERDWTINSDSAGLAVMEILGHARIFDQK